MTLKRLIKEAIEIERRAIQRNTKIYAQTIESHLTTHYTWKAVGDGKTRKSHKDNHNKKFAWNKRPPTGHPGEDFGCRCVAEPYFDSLSDLIDDISAQLSLVRKLWKFMILRSGKWTNSHFVANYYTASFNVTLGRIGHMNDAKRHYKDNYFDRFKDQIKDKAKDLPDGPIQYNILKAYSFVSVLFSHGDSVIKGDFSGNIYTEKSGKRCIEGIADINFSDKFKDPLDIATLSTFVLKLFSSVDSITEDEVYPLVKHIADVGGTPYNITGEWKIPVKEIL